MNFADFGYVFLLVVFACGKVTLQGRASRGHIRNMSDSLVFNALMFASIAICVLLFFPKSLPNAGIVGMAALTAVLTMVFQTVYAVSLMIGPVSITVLIVNFSVLLTTAMSVVLFHDPLYLTQLFGIVMLLLSMLLSVDRSGDCNGISVRWLILALVSAVTSGICSILQKSFSKMPFADAAHSDTLFLVFMYAFSSLFAVGLYLFRSRTGKKEKSPCWRDRHIFVYAGGIGLLLAVYQKLYMNALATIDGTFLFPTFSGLQSLGMSVIGVVLFGDRLNPKQIVGVLCGVVGIVLMNLCVGIRF